MPDDQPASILTNRQRAFLQGDTDIEGRAERAAWARIRKRVQTGLRDFPLVVYTVDPADIADGFDPTELFPALRSQIAFVYHVAQAADIDINRLFGEGLMEGQAGRVAVLKARFEDGDGSLELPDLQLLQHAGEISQEELYEYIETAYQAPSNYMSDWEEKTVPLHDVSNEE